MHNPPLIIVIKPNNAIKTIDGLPASMRTLLELTSTCVKLGKGGIGLVQNICAIELVLGRRLVSRLVE